MTDDRDLALAELEAAGVIAPAGFNDTNGNAARPVARARPEILPATAHFSTPREHRACIRVVAPVRFP
jgi:hypothetical protein